MAGKKGSDNSKKAAGQARKADAAASKAAVENSKKAAVEDEEWSKGSKNNAKKYVASNRPLSHPNSPRKVFGRFEMLVREERPDY